MPSRLRKLCLSLFVAALAVAVLPVYAGADVYPTVSVALDDSRLGAHSGMYVAAEFDYSWDESDAINHWDESLKHLVVETPAGFVGNPNAIPYEDRCDPVVFETGICPASSMVGTIFVQLESIGTVEEFLDYGYEPGTGATVNAGGDLHLLKTDPEVPATIGMRVAPSVSGFSPERQLLKIEPNTDGQLELRTTTINPIVNEQPLASFPDRFNNLKVRYMEIEFFGALPNGNAFLTNPTECVPWTTRAWAQAWNLNTNADADPLSTGTNNFVAATPTTITPDCSNQASIPFPAKGKVAISSPKRNDSPDFDFTIDNPGVQANGQVSTSPKKVVTTIPAAINVDVQQLGRTCQIADFKADSCPVSSRVGSVKIDTPLISKGLSGDVYLVKRIATSGLPDLGLRVRGAITFTQLGSNRYVGEKFNQIETTFDNIPQVGFSRLAFHLDGGPSGLLRSRSCPTYNKEPGVASFAYTFTAWTGATHTSSEPLNMANCFGIQYFKPYGKCLHKKLPIHPNYQSRTRVKSVRLKLDGKQKLTSKKSPFRFDVNIRKLKPGKHNFELNATYDDGTVSTKKVNFKRCR